MCKVWSFLMCPVLLLLMLLLLCRVQQNAYDRLVGGSVVCSAAWCVHPEPEKTFTLTLAALAWYILGVLQT